MRVITLLGATACLIEARSEFEGVYAPVCARGETRPNWAALHREDPTLAASDEWAAGPCELSARRLGAASDDAAARANASAARNGTTRNGTAHGDAAHDDAAHGGGGDHGDHHHAHAYLLVCFAFVVIALGVATEAALARYVPAMPYTVALFVEVRDGLLNSCEYYSY